MTQVDQGLRGLLSRAGNYDFLQWILGAGRVRRIFSTEYIQALRGMKVLDVGCGTGAILDHLPEVDYLGFDLSPDYVEAATKRFGPRNRFICADVNKVQSEAEGSFDRVLAVGLLHHLDDPEVMVLLNLAYRLLAPGGQLVTLDPCYRDGQPLVAQFLIDHDRGRNIRAEPAYVDLARSVFPQVKSFLREDLLRLPYTHIVLRCSLDPIPGT